jgi:hypothetical protein
MNDHSKPHQDEGGAAMANERVFAMSFASVYPMYVQKAQRKGRSQEEVDAIIFWLTGYDEQGLAEQIAQESSFADFFAQAPKLNPAASQITGSVCGVRVQDVADPLMQKIRWLDKLVDELAKGKPLEKILREGVG